ncbi:MAG: glycosyltransferase [Desulfobulbaceae bacterium]|nr:glycosyltransferase [Desulfobulbaceae bacterium]
MKKLVFAVAGYNLAETGRMIEIAKAAKKYFNIIFASYGGQFEELIEGEGFNLVKMSPRLSEEKLARLRVVLSGETLNTVGYLSVKELKIRVPSEIAFFKKNNPAAVLTGWCLSVTISSRAAGVPFINVLHSTSVREYYEAGLQSWPDRSNFAFFRWLFRNDEDRMNRFMSSLVLKLSFPARAYNTVGSEYGLPKFKNFIDLIEGDHTLLADIPEWVGFSKVRPTLHYVGPLPTKIERPVPEEVASVPRDKQIVYFAMGSSGKPALVAEILQSFCDRPYRVIAPVKSHIKQMKVDIPKNVIVTGFVPAHKVNSMADISVIHGGQNTVMNACISGTPIVGIGMHPEQQANLDACVRKGFAIRLSKKKTTAADVLDAIDKLLHDKNAKKAVDAFSLQLKKWNGPENAARFLLENYG